MAMDITRLQAWRHTLHRIPDTAFHEHVTADWIAEQLEQLGLEVTRGIGGTGVVGTLRRGSGTRAIALRADMDGLPIDERADRDLVSEHPGRMHACGHDGHMTMVLGAAAELAEQGGFDGTVRFLFQPAEEPGLGAQAMLDDDLMRRLPFDEVYGLHNIPGIEAGRIHVRVGAIMASEDNFVITITGVGGHASAPHLVIDPLVAGAQVVTALQTIVSRSVDPLQPAVVSCTEFTTDGARNAIPGSAIIKGDCRTFDAPVSALIERRMRDLCAGIAAATGASIDVQYSREFAPTVNDAECAAAVATAARTALGDEAVDDECQPITASEDFGLFARAVPGAFAFIGNGAVGELGGTPLHSRDYRFNDSIMPAGVSFYVQLVRDRLPTT